MTRFPRILPLSLLFAALPANAAGLPDTGQDICYNDTGTAYVSTASDTGTHPRQDCRYGRDAANKASTLSKIGTGYKGLDYTKIANGGADLPASAALGAGLNDWACTRDNVTGLTWEVKTATPTDSRYVGRGYEWYSSDSNTNGGVAGYLPPDSACHIFDPVNLYCNTEEFVAIVNAMALCSSADWRMPTRRELFTLIQLGKTSPAMDEVFFPDVVAAWGFWTGTTAGDPAHAWVVNLTSGNLDHWYKTNRIGVRLVRGEKF